MVPFSKVNRSGSNGHDPRLQRHHLIPQQVASMSDVEEVSDLLLSTRFQFDDFSTNGVLLPCDEQVALDTGLPLHRGPHPRYNKLVIEQLFLIVRLGSTIEDDRERIGLYCFKLRLLQVGLRLALTRSGFSNLCLNRRDPLRSNRDFGRIDADIDKLYPVLK